MNFGIPKEVRPLEFRVSLTPAAVDSLVRAGHHVMVENHAGSRAGFHDEEYEAAGARIVYDTKELYGRADVIVKIGRLMESEYGCLRRGQVIFSFLHLAVASADLLGVLKSEKVTAVGYETIEADDGTLPVLVTTSEVTGRLAPIIAGELLGSLHGGRGILLAGVPGTPPAAVVILGAGVLGFNALRAFHSLGADLTILDHDLKALQQVDDRSGGRIATLFANPHNIAKVVKFADVLVCTAASAGRRAPVLVTREMLKTMRSRAVVLDFAINSGGNVETSRPTRLDDPCFIEENVIHYCVPNVPSRVARTASYAHANAILPYLLEMGAVGFPEILQTRADLRRGVNILEGRLVHPSVAASMGKPLETNK